jgi:lactoylglutathione lyase
MRVLCRVAPARIRREHSDDGQETNAMKTVTALAHVAIRVKDVDRSLDFYVKKLGFREMMRIHRDDGSLMLIYLRITDTQFLEIFPDAIGDRSPPKEAIGFNHICLEVDDIDEALAHLKEQDVPLLQEKKIGLDRNKQAWVEDPDGNRIEFMEMAKNSLQSEALARLHRGERLIAPVDGRAWD